jgi:hypothetical protein
MSQGSPVNIFTGRRCLTSRDRARVPVRQRANKRDSHTHETPTAPRTALHRSSASSGVPPFLPSHPQQQHHQPPRRGVNTYTTDRAPASGQTQHRQGLTRIDANGEWHQPTKHQQRHGPAPTSPYPLKPIARRDAAGWRHPGSRGANRVFAGGECSKPQAPGWRRTAGNLTGAPPSLSCHQQLKHLPNRSSTDQRSDPRANRCNGKWHEPTKQQQRRVPPPPPQYSSNPSPGAAQRGGATLGPGAPIGCSPEANDRSPQGGDAPRAT